MDEKDMQKRSHRREKTCENLSFAAKEAFKRLRTNVVMRFVDGDNPGHIIGHYGRHHFRYIQADHAFCGY